MPQQFKVVTVCELCIHRIAVLEKGEVCEGQDLDLINPLTTAWRISETFVNFYKFLLKFILLLYVCMYGQYLA